MSSRTAHVVQTNPTRSIANMKKAWSIRKSKPYLEIFEKYYFVSSAVPVAASICFKLKN